MPSLKQKIETANAGYAARKRPSAHPLKKFAILTCMDARMDPSAFAGLSDDAYVIRNAGGRATEDAIRSLLISAKLLGTTEWFVIHHTDCGMVSFTNEIMTSLLQESLGPAKYTEQGWHNVSDEAGATAPVSMDFHPFTDPVESLIEDVSILRNHPLVSKRIPIYGYLYDVHTGQLTEILDASAIGKVMI